MSNVSHCLIVSEGVWVGIGCDMGSGNESDSGRIKVGDGTVAMALAAIVSETRGCLGDSSATTCGAGDWRRLVSGGSWLGRRLQGWILEDWYGFLPLRISRWQWSRRRK
jgi:hypothetical protein